MAVHYPKELNGRILRSELRPVTIDAGGGICWQGGVAEEEQLFLIDLIQQFRKAFPESQLRMVDETYGTWVQRMKDTGGRLPPSQQPIPLEGEVFVDPAFVTPPIPGIEPATPAPEPKPRKKKAGRPKGSKTKPRGARI